MKTKNIIQIIIIVVLILGIGMFINRQGLIKQSSVKSGHHDLYHCPMHPQIIYDHPGRCPICGMDLVKIVEAQQQEGNAVEGYATISETDQRQQLAGVKTAVIEKKDLVKSIRAAGQYEGQVFAQVFEGDLAYIKVGQQAIVEAPALHKKYEGSVNSIDTSIDETTRTLRVRIWLKQTDQRKFKTNMFVNVEFPVAVGSKIFVPRQAVMDTGMRKIVFVEKNEGSFEPREIQTGAETDDGFEVTSGLKEGERIVVSGNFLLDSESRVQASLEQGASHGE